MNDQLAFVATNAPSRGVVFVQLLWRTIVISVLGGLVVSVLFVSAAFVFDENDDEVRTWLPVVLVIAVLMGLMLGVVAGVLTGLVGAILMVPYRGKAFARWFVLIATLLSVGSFFAIIGFSSDAAVIWVIVGGGALLLGALMSPWPVGWYVKRMSAGSPRLDRWQTTVLPLDRWSAANWAGLRPPRRSRKDGAERCQRCSEC